jgi:hypothetical protein
MELHSDNIYLRSKVKYYYIISFARAVELLYGSDPLRLSCLPLENLSEIPIFIQVAENERGHDQSMGMQMGAASTGEYGVVVPAPYDPRNFLQMSIMQQPQHYSHQLQPTTLSLG